MKKRTNNWHLLWVIALTDFKMRYHGSVLGYLWSLLKPLLLFLVLYVVFSVLMRWDVENYQLHLLLGIILWNFFAESTSAGVHSLLSKASIIKKVYFPRYLVVLASTVSAFITLLLNLFVFLLIYLFSGMSFDLTMLLFFVILLLLYFLSVGASLFLSVLQVRYRDVSQIWDVLLQAGFFLAPVIYPLSIVPENYWKYLYLNPITGIIEYSRDVLINHQIPDLSGTLYLFLFVVAILLFGSFIFKKLVKSIAEKI